MDTMDIETGGEMECKNWQWWTLTPDVQNSTLTAANKSSESSVIVR